MCMVCVCLNGVYVRAHVRICMVSVCTCMCVYIWFVYGVCLCACVCIRTFLSIPIYYLSFTFVGGGDARAFLRRQQANPFVHFALIAGHEFEHLQQ